ncbi:MAG: phosphoglycerate mutase family protein [Erysipelotrichaceae bacterium]|nr:phosphoglycerate mutase family protein [Erysipelotrichaceae bacterium]
MKDLYLMRHGQTLFNVLQKIQGWCDSPLTEDGIKQAKAAKELLKDIDFDHYYSSTSERSCDTLELITDKPYIRLKGLKERYFSVFEGESEALNPPLDQYDSFFPLVGGETDKDVEDRMVSTLTDIMNKEDHQCVLAVSHAGACVSFLGKWSDAQKVMNQYGGFPNCSILHFKYDNNIFYLEEVLIPTI